MLRVGGEQRRQWRTGDDGNLAINERMLEEFAVEVSVSVVEESRRKRSQARRAART
jgi:hypothetical protein